MRPTRAAGLLILGTTLLAPAQVQQYVMSTYAGGAPPPTPTLSIDKAIGNAGSFVFDHPGTFISSPSIASSDWTSVE